MKYLYRYQIRDDNMQLLCTIMFISAESPGIYLNKHFPYSMQQNKRYWFQFVKKAAIYC